MRTNAQLVDDIGTRADLRGARRLLAENPAATAREIGTAKHDYAKRLLRRYQEMFDDRGLLAESTWKNGFERSYGTAGAVRLDVFDPATGAVWDYKFGVTPMSAAQRAKIMAHGPGVTSITTVMKP